MFSKVLIVNRGLIQANCVRAAKELGCQAITVYAPNDKNSSGVRNADEAWELEPKSSGIPYLDIEQIVDLAAKLKVDAVHPGYGFLSQNADFKNRLNEKGIKLISADNIEGYDLANKPQIREFARKMGIPILPGSETCGSVESLAEAAKSVGYPLVMKATEGYGGIGIRVIEREGELEASYHNVIAQSERFMFNAHQVYLERFFPRARHIEFPVARDKHGNTVMFPERDCTIQRRFQKLITESPSPFLPDSLRSKLKSAVHMLMDQLQVVGFVSVEFLYDGNQAYFIEVNSYMQPSHGVSALLTGVDMLREQIALAAGNPLSYRESDLETDKFVMGVFVSAEDTERNFVPSPGVITRMHLPYGDGVYSLTNVFTNDTVATFYDPIIALVMVRERTREKALIKMQSALDALHIDGVKTSVPLMRALMRFPEFKRGDFDCQLLANKETRDRIFENVRTPTDSEIAGILAALSLQRDASKQHILEQARTHSRGNIWDMASEWFSRSK